MNQDIHDLVEAYAVGALTGEEAATFQAHLETCDACRRDLDELGAVTVALSASVAVEPPPGLRAAVLAEIARTPQESSSAAARSMPSPGSAGADAKPPPVDLARQPSTAPPGPDPTVVPLRRRAPARWAASVVAAAAILAAAAFGGLWWQERQDADDAANQANQLTRLLGAADVRTVPGVSKRHDQAGTIVMSRSQHRAVFVASDLPDLPDDKVYEAWTIQGSAAPEPAGTFSPERAQAIVALPKASFEADTMAITVEPEGGSDAPTSDPVVTFTIPSS